MKLSKISGLITKYSAYLPIIFFGTLMLVAINHYAVNVPYSDQWDFVAYLQKMDANTLNFHDLFAQHNEHRIPFPLAVLLLSAKLTHWNTITELLLGFSFSLITIFLVIKMLRNTKPTKINAFITSVFVTGWFFSPAQWENWLWGWQIEWFMNIAAVTAVIYLLTSLKYKQTYLLTFFAGIMAFIATFSLGSGMLIWLVGGGLLLLRKNIKQALYVWFPMAIISVTAYYHNYAAPSYHPSPKIIFTDPASVVKFYLSLFGRSVSGNEQAAIIIGAILLGMMIPIAYMVYASRKKILVFLPGLSLMAYALLAAFVTTLSRAGFGVSYSLASRYAAFSLYYVIGLTLTISVIFTINKVSKQTAQTTYGAALGFIVLATTLLVFSYSSGKSDMSHYSSLLHDIKSCTHQLSPSTTCMRSTYQIPSAALKDLQYLKQKHLAGY